MLTCSGDYPKGLLRPNHASPHKVRCPQFQLQTPIPELHFKSFPARGRVYRWQSDAYADLTHFSPDSSASTS
jgi:hypothetical protein